MNKPTKKVYVILYHVSDGVFYMINHDGECVWPAEKGQKLRDISNYAFDNDADEVKHSYDCSKYGRD